MRIQKYVLVDKHSIAPALHQGPLDASDLLYVSIARRRNSQSRSRHHISQCRQKNATLYPSPCLLPIQSPDLTSQSYSTIAMAPTTRSTSTLCTCRECSVFQTIDTSTGILRPGQQVDVKTRKSHAIREERRAAWARGANEEGKPLDYSFRPC
jgi:hypothetical protein